MTHTGLMALGLMMGGLGLSGEDDEDRRRRLAARNQGFAYLYDPRELENDFRNMDAVYLDNVPVLSVLFRVVGEDALAIFPSAPVVGSVDGKRSEFVFLWRDGPPAQQAPIDLMVEVRAVTVDNRRGPPTQLRIAAAPGS